MTGTVTSSHTSPLPSHSFALLFSCTSCWKPFALPRFWRSEALLTRRGLATTKRLQTATDRLCSRKNGSKQRPPQHLIPCDTARVIPHERRLPRLVVVKASANFPCLARHIAPSRNVRCVGCCNCRCLICVCTTADFYDSPEIGPTHGSKHTHELKSIFHRPA